MDPLAWQEDARKADTESAQQLAALHAGAKSSSLRSHVASSNIKPNLPYLQRLQARQNQAAASSPPSSEVSLVGRGTRRTHMHSRQGVSWKLAATCPLPPAPSPAYSTRRRRIPFGQRPSCQALVCN